MILVHQFVFSAEDYSAEMVIQMIIQKDDPT